MDRFRTYEGMCRWAEERSLVVHVLWDYSARPDHLSVYVVPFVASITTDNGELTCVFDNNGTLIESFFISSDEPIRHVDRSGSLRSKLNHLMYESEN